jgi:hypothetical protein
VRLKSGELLLKRVLPGTKRGRYHLVSVGASGRDAQDQAIEALSTIEWTLTRP